MNLSKLPLLVTLSWLLPVFLIAQTNVSDIFGTTAGALREYSYNGRVAIVTGEGKVLIPRYEGMIEPLSGSIGAVSFRIHPHTSDFLLPSGDLLFGGKYDKVERLPYSLSNIHKEYLGLMRIRKSGLWGVGTETGKVIIPPTMKYVRLNGGLLNSPEGVMLRDGTPVKK